MKYAVLIFTLLLLYGRTKAQHPVYRHYTVNDGLPSSEVHCVVQDKEGFIWFGTDRGVCRFDGYNFKTYTTADGLGDNTIFNIFDDSLKRLWFCGITGRLSYFYVDHIFPLRSNNQIQNSLKNNFITSLYADRYSIAWLSTQNKPTIWRISHMSVDSFNTHGAYSYIKIIDNSGFIIGNRKELSNSLNDTLEIIDDKGSHLVPYRRFTVSSRLWCLRMHNGNYLYAKGQNLLQIKNNTIISNCFLARADYICITEDHEGKIWIGYPKGGAVCYKYHNGRLDSISSYLPGKTISRILEDRESNVWFTTVEEGVYLITSKAFNSYTSKDGLGGDRITCLSGDENVLWAGTGNGYINGIDKQERIFASLSLHNSGNPVQSLLFDSHQKLWIGTAVYNYPLSYKYSTPMVLKNGVKAFAENKDYSIWAGRSEDICRYKGTDPRECMKLDFNNFVDALCEDRDGNLWIGCLNGLWKYDKKTFIYYGDKDNRLRSRVTGLKMDKSGRIWMTTLGEGVIIMDNEKLNQLTMRDSLPSNLCNSLYLDKENIAWVCTNQGLCRITPIPGAGFNIKNYNIANGLISNEVYSAFRQRDKIWVATSSGLTVFDINGIKNAVKPPLVYITSLVINGRDTNTIQNLKLSYNQNFLNIKFLGLLFKSMGHVKYRYKMIGIDTGWMYTSFTSVQYPAMPPGDYSFVVSAADYYGNWVDDKAMIHFSISPPFWKQVWFLPGILLLIFLVSAAVIYSVLQQFVQRKNMLEQLNMYKHQALSAQMSPHFIFNALNSIQKYILLNDKISSNKYLTSFAGLMRITFENSLQTIIPLESELNALKLYLELEKMRFKEKLEYNININPYIALVSIKIPALLIQPFVENSIRHGIMHKDGIGHIGITIEEKGGSVICTIEDDGIGRANAAEFNKVRNNKHHSAGMELSRNRVEIMNMLYKTDMGISVEDILKNGEVAGTRVSIILPAINKKVAL